MSFGKGSNMKFKVKSGRHCDDHRTYDPGDIVASPVDLCKLFPNKFERVGKWVDLEDDAPDKGESVEEVDVGLPGSVQAEDEDSDGGPHPPIISVSELAEKYGDDVTDKFPQAELLNVYVFRLGKAGAFRIVSATTGKRVNRIKLTTVAKTRAYLRSQLES